MTATRPTGYGKCAFLFLLAGTLFVQAQGPDMGWRYSVLPSFIRPSQSDEIPGSSTSILAVARDSGYGELEYATTRGAKRWARERATRDGSIWLMDAHIEFRRDENRVIEHILITADDPLMSAMVMAPAFYEWFEPMLGDGFHVIIPDRNTIALYPRLAGEIPPEDATALLELYQLATYPISREVFRAQPGGLQADGILED